MIGIIQTRKGFDNCQKKKLKDEVEEICAWEKAVALVGGREWQPRRSSSSGKEHTGGMEADTSGEWRGRERVWSWVALEGRMMLVIKKARVDCERVISLCLGNNQSNLMNPIQI